MNTQTTGRGTRKILGLFEDGFETLVNLGQEIAGVEPKTETKEATKFSAGSINFNENQARQAEIEKIKKDQKEINRQKDFFQILEKSQEQVQRENERLFEEEINDIATNLPTEQKNRLLGYQASYRDRGNVYQRAELRKKLIEQRKETEKQQKAAAAPKNTKGGFNVGENELLMGGERSGGSHWTTTPG